MKTITGGFSSAKDSSTIAADVLGLKTSSIEAPVDEKEAKTLELLLMGKHPQEIGDTTGYGYAYALGVSYRHKDEIITALKELDEKKAVEKMAAATATEEARIRRLVGAGELPLSALDPYLVKEEVETAATFDAKKIDITITSQEIGLIVNKLKEETTK